MLGVLYRKMRNIFFLLLSFPKKFYMCSIILLERAALSSSVCQALRYPGDKWYQPFTESPGSLADCWKLLIMPSEFRNVLSFSSSLGERKTEFLITRGKRNAKQPFRIKILVGETLSSCASYSLWDPGMLSGWYDAYHKQVACLSITHSIFLKMSKLP